MWRNKEEVIAGLKKWMDADPKSGEAPVASGDGRTFTLKEMIEEIQNDTEYGKKLLEAALANDTDCCSDHCDCEH